MPENRPGPPHTVGTRFGFEWNRFSGKDALIELPQVMLQPNSQIRPGERNREKLPVEIDSLNDRKWIDVRVYFLPCIFEEDDFGLLIKRIQLPVLHQANQSILVRRPNHVQQS